MTLSAPSAGSTFTSSLNMAATASDDRGVSKVEFWFDGARVSRDTSAPYAATFTAGRWTSFGVHTVSVRAFDAAGNARSAAVTVTRLRYGAPHPERLRLRPGPRRVRLHASPSAFRGRL